MEDGDSEEELLPDSAMASEYPHFNIGRIYEHNDEELPDQGNDIFWEDTYSEIGSDGEQELGQGRDVTEMERPTAMKEEEEENVGQYDDRKFFDRVEQDAYDQELFEETDNEYYTESYTGPEEGDDPQEEKEEKKEKQKDRDEDIQKRIKEVNEEIRVKAKVTKEKERNFVYPTDMSHECKYYTEGGHDEDDAEYWNRVGKQSGKGRRGKEKEDCSREVGEGSRKQEEAEAEEGRSSSSRTEEEKGRSRSSRAEEEQGSSRNKPSKGKGRQTEEAREHGGDLVQEKQKDRETIAKLKQDIQS
ncbi:unnamed protein product [Symbiodinium sp. CCMP2456]|nr:unnamed protein product [Symbiodinium sp. CCMP2456]